jgi:Flp pilus assembly protein TadB
MERESFASERERERFWKEERKTLAAALLSEWKIGRKKKTRARLISLSEKRERKKGRVKTERGGSLRTISLFSVFVVAVVVVVVVVVCFVRVGKKVEKEGS